MTIYKLCWENNFQDIQTNYGWIRPNFGACYIEEKDFDTEFEAGLYVGGIPNKDILFTDKTAAYTAMVKENIKIFKNLIKELKGE